MPGGEIICLLRGLTDVPLEDLGGLTPLQKAAHPILDKFAQAASCSQILTPDAGGEGLLLQLLGIDDPPSFMPRGPLIAAALRLDLPPGHIAYTLRLVSAGRDTIVDVDDTLVRDSEGRALCLALSELDPSLRFVHIQGPEALLVTDHPAFSQPKPQTPLSPAEVVGRPWQKTLPKGINRRPAIKLLQAAHELLSHHEVNQVRAELEEAPINALWISEGGPQPSLPKTATDTLIQPTTKACEGIARLAGASLWTLPPVTAKFGLLRQILDGLPQALSTTSRLILEIPYLWDATYRGALLEKVKTIEWLDRHLIGPLWQYAHDHSLRLTITTPALADIRSGKQYPGPVPLATLPSGDGPPLPRFDESTFAQLSIRRRSVSADCAACARTNGST